MMQPIIISQNIRNFRARATTGSGDHQPIQPDVQGKMKSVDCVQTRTTTQR